MLRIGIVAGEESGDMLGASLIEELKGTSIDIELTGIGGKKLIELGCNSLYPIEKLSVMGLIEVVRHYFELLTIRNDLKNNFLKNPPDLFIGVDAPDFNFSLERTLRRAGIKTIHYVSPSIWAWREYRLKKISESVDLLLTLFPFEVEYYSKKNIPAVFVGHPLAEKIKLKSDKIAARKKLGIPNEKQVIAIMPGSRPNEIKCHTKPFVLAAEKCRDNINDLQIIAGLTNEKMAALFKSRMKQSASELPVTIITGQAQDVMESADVILLASGTVALEAMLLKRPMVVAYKLNRITYEVAKRMVNIPYVSLPNILAGHKLVPECLQKDCNPENLYTELMNWMDNQESVSRLEQTFLELHKKLIPPSRNIASDAVLKLINA